LIFYNKCCFLLLQLLKMVASYFSVRVRSSKSGVCGKPNIRGVTPKLRLFITDTSNVQGVFNSSLKYRSNCNSGKPLEKGDAWGFGEGRNK
jgi:hypothetical protein